MTDLCKKFGLDVDKAINQLLDYRNSSTKQVGLFANSKAFFEKNCRRLNQCGS